MTEVTLPPWPLRCPGAPWVRMVPDRPNVIKAGDHKITCNPDTASNGSRPRAGVGSLAAARPPRCPVSISRLPPG